MARSSAQKKVKGSKVSKTKSVKLKKPVAKKSTTKKSAPKPKPASDSKKAPKLLKSREKLLKKAKNAVSHLVGKPSASNAATAAKAKASSNKPSLPLQNVQKAFMEFWDVKNDTFMSAIRNFLANHSIPGSTDKQKADNVRAAVQKIEDYLRREPIPESILAELKERLDPQRIRQISAIFSMKPRTTVRLNILKADIGGFGASRAGEDLKAKRGRLSPWAYELDTDADPTEHPAFERGIFELEDEASQFASLLLNARPGQRVLDLCAREGDHTLGIAAMMKNKGSLFVYDSDPQKLKVLKTRADRAGIDNYRILTDSQISEVKSLDAILVDAPCSGSGQLGRRPEIKWRFKKEDLPKLQKIQAGLLREAARKLKLGGRVVYVTSSLNASENEAQIEHFLRTSHNSYRLVPMREYLKESVLDFVRNFYGFEFSDEVLETMLASDPFLIIPPDLFGSNGLFAAVIERVRISA